MASSYRSEVTSLTDADQLKKMGLVERLVPSVFCGPGGDSVKMPMPLRAASLGHQMRPHVPACCVRDTLYRRFLPVLAA